MESHKEVISKIKLLNLKKYPYRDLKLLLRELGAFGVILTTLHKGKKIIRARINDNEETFDNVSKLSFKPKQYNKTYQRASTPFNTMFYGAVTPEYLEEGENELERITIFSELANSNGFLKDSNSKGELKITFARWDVLEDIHLVSVISHKDFQKGYGIIRGLQNEFTKALDKSGLKERSLEISEFLASEFAKGTINTDSDYLISAIFSELACEKFDGVYYPSVRMQGDGINVAIKPNSVKDKMVFVGASECTVYKNKMNVVIGNNSKAKLLDNAELEFIKLNEFSPEFYKAQVGLK